MMGKTMKKITNSTADENRIKPISLKSNVLVQESKKELLLYDQERNKAYCLNETSAMIWNLCDGENTVEDIRRRASLELKTQVPEDVVWLALDGLKNEKLLTNHQEIKVDFSGLSRRQVIRKAGLATMIALPLISTLIAPTAASAQSVGVCSSATFCVCADASCVELGAPALLQDPCSAANCSGSGGSNCRCVGRFFCSTNRGERFGRCGLV